MCQRKIINNTHSYTVPLLNGCDCPMVKEFRHIQNPSSLSPKERALILASKKNYCFDMHSQIPAGPEGMFVIFRHCVCKHFTGMCLVLPPLFFVYDPEELTLHENEDDDGEEPYWGVGGGSAPVRPR